MVRNYLVVGQLVASQTPVTSVLRSEVMELTVTSSLCHSQWLVWVIPVNHLLHRFICWNWRAVFSVCPKLLVCVQHLHYYMDSNLGEDNDGGVIAL